MTNMTIPLKSPFPSNVVVWGSDDDHQCSDRPLVGHYTQIATGGSKQLLALTDGGVPELWGGFVPPPPPMRIVPSLSFDDKEKYIKIAIGISAVAAIRGSNHWIDTCGTFGPNDARVPESYFLLGMQFQDVALGGDHGLALATDGTLLQWGAGEGTAPQGTFQKVWARSDFSVAMDTQGNLYGWGGNLFSPPVRSGRSISSLPGTGWQFNAPGGYWFHAGPFLTVAVGAPKPPAVPPAPRTTHVLAILPDHSVVGWGDNSSSQISGAPSGKFIEIAAGQGFSVGLDDKNQLKPWGKPLPTSAGAIPQPKGSFKSIGAGTNHASALRL